MAQHYSIAVLPTGPTNQEIKGKWKMPLAIRVPAQESDPGDEKVAPKHAAPP